MHAPRFAPLVALAFVSLSLAGCIGRDRGNGPEPVVNAGENETALNSTDTPDGRGQIAAFKETNATEKGLGGMSHDHDYWNGRSRVDIAWFDGGLIPIPLTPRDEPAGTAIADFNVPAPNLVFEGTGQVEVLFSNVTSVPGTTAPHPNLNIHVKYLTAADEPGEWRDAGNAKPDVPLILPVKPLETDMPHSVASLWLFRIFTDEPNEFWFNVTITAVRGNEIATWPPHPDLYANGPERVIFDGPAQTVVQPATDFLLYGEDSNWFYPERVISWGTDKLLVEVTDLAYASDVPAASPSEIYLDFHNASFAPKVGNGGTSGGSAHDPATDGANFRFEVPVTAYGYDSPYGTASRWAFRMLASFDDGALGDGDAIFCTTCSPYTLNYRLKITAIGHSTAEGDDVMAEAASEPEPEPPARTAPAVLPLPPALQ